MNNPQEETVPFKLSPDYMAIEIHATTSKEENPDGSSKTRSVFRATRERHQFFKKFLVVFGISALWGISFSVFSPFGRQATDRAPESWDPRKRWIDTGFEDLSGDFKLFDLLGIKSESGSISAHIWPQPESASNPKPAELQISTFSGAVNLFSNILDPPKRNYSTSIDTFSGSVKGSILHGKKTKISTYSGSIDAHFVLYGTGNYSSTLTTSTSSGGQDIRILTSVGDKGLPLTEMKSVHSTESGTLKLRYDSQWEGLIEGHSELGRLKLHGDDIEIIRRGSFPPSGEYVVAKKGNGNSTLRFHTNSGWIDVYFGLFGS